MSKLDKEVKFGLKVIVNKEKSKVLFAEANGDFVDVLLSFLTMPLGKVVEVLQKHYGDDAPVIGSLNSLYKGLANLDSDYFWTEGAKQMVLNPRSSFETECLRLKLDIADTQPPECLICIMCGYSIISIYDAATCINCGYNMKQQMVKMESQAGGVFVKNTASFVISDDLQILPDGTGLTHIISLLGITVADGVELMNVTFGFREVMYLFNASMFSGTPLSDLILARNRQQMNLATVKSEPGLEMDATVCNSNKMILKVIVRKSTNKILYAQVGEDFIDFLISLLTIPLGKTVSLLGRRSCFKGIDNLHRSIADLIDKKFLKTEDMITRLIFMKLPHGSVSKNQILPISEKLLPDCNRYSACFSSANFPEGQGKYVKGLRTYAVADDLTVSPFCVSSTISMLNGLNIPLLDINEVELQIGQPEGLRILKASLTSTCVLSDALNISLVSNKQL